MTEPVSPQEIDDLPGVQHSFQADRDFEKIYETSPEAGALCDISSVCLKFAGNMAEQAGLGSLERMVATCDDQRLMLFSLNAKNATPPGPRIFGITTDTTVKIEKISKQITALL